MRQRSHRRQIILFLSAVILPCSVLVAFGLRMVGQERELAEARLLQDRNRLARQLGEDLLFDLGQSWSRVRAAFDAAADLTYDGAAEHVVFVAEVDDGRLVFPWENDDLQASPGEMPLLSAGERQEVGADDLQAAARAYQRALDGAGNLAQAGLARLYLARVLAKRGLSDDALTQYRALFAVPPTVTDEAGIPFSYYAADQVLDLGTGIEDVVAFVNREARRPDWRTPLAVHLLHDVAGKLVDAVPADPARDSALAAESLIAARVRETEQLVALASDLGNLGLAATADVTNPDRWVPYGSEPWLLGMGRATDGTTLLAAIRAEGALQAAAARTEEEAALDLVPSLGPEGVILHPRLQGLRARMTLAEAAGLESAIVRQRAFYGIALFLVVGFTLFGAWLLWRDMQREVRMARLRSQFVSGVSHELRTPLTSIRMFAETLLERGADDPAIHDEFLTTIVDESNRLSRLLANVLEFSAIERGKRQYRMQPRDLGEIVRAAVRAVQQRIESERFELQMAVDEDVPPVSVDGDAIEQAVLNLLTNAMKFSGDSRRIDLGLRCEDGHAVISVADRGLGIRPSEQRRIFESFYRAESPGVEEVPGTGLGLTLVEHIVEVHGGKIELQSSPGQGSTFELHLPLAHSES